MFENYQEKNLSCHTSEQQKAVTHVCHSDIQKLNLLAGKNVDEKLQGSRSSRYAKLDPNSPSFDPNFPVPVRIGPNSVRWIEAELDAYIAGLPRTREIQGNVKILDSAKGDRS